MIPNYHLRSRISHVMDISCTFTRPTDCIKLALVTMALYPGIFMLIMQHFLDKKMDGFVT